MQTLLDDEAYMRMALQMAEQTIGQTGVNPAVGCIVVKDGRIVGLGAHLERGKAHAEVHALNMAGLEAEGSTVYVTLEPCSHFGQTPPCSDRLIQEKIKRVVVATRDPNPQVAGSGIARLRQHGIQVDVGILEQEARQLNEVFNKYIVTRLPFVTLKTASTLDGKIASRTGDSKWITNEAARAFVHALRHRHQAIMVGVGTVIADDPSLTARLSVPALQPVRVIIDSMLRTPETAKVIQQCKEARTLIITTQSASAEKEARLRSLGVEIIHSGVGPKVDLAQAMKALGELEISSILLEGGGRLNGSMLEAGLIDKLVLFYAPKIIGGILSPGNFVFEGFERMKDAIHLQRVRFECFEDNFCCIGYVHS